MHNKKNKHIEFIKEYGVLFLIIGLPIIGGIIMFIVSMTRINTKESVHWHMPISYDLCGDKTQLKDSGKHGKLHGHDDNKAHVEGVVDMDNRNESLGVFFDTTDIPFSETQIGKYKNGYICKGSQKAGKVSVIINGKPNFDFRNYILNDKDEIKILFK